jgi:hypothetical protein
MSSESTLVSRMIIRQISVLPESNRAVAMSTQAPQIQQIVFEWPRKGSLSRLEKRAELIARSPLLPPPSTVHDGPHALLTGSWFFHQVAES